MKREAAIAFAIQVNAAHAIVLRSLVVLLLAIAPRALVAIVFPVAVNRLPQMKV